MPHRGESVGALIWCRITEDEVAALDEALRQHNSILGRLKGRRLRASSRSAFIGDLIENALLEWVMPPDADMESRSKNRVRYRLRFGSAQELLGRVDQENARRVRWGGRTVTVEDAGAAVVRRFLRTRQQATEPTASENFSEAIPPPVLAAAYPFPSERIRVWERWNAMIGEELQRRKDAAEWELLCDDPWCLFFARNDAVRIGVSMFATSKGGSPSLLHKLGFVGITRWLEPRLRVASGGFRR